VIEKYTGKKARFEYKEFHKVDTKATWADIEKAKNFLDWQPQVSLEEEIKRRLKWTKDNCEWIKNIKIS